jgi:hypothetical protein
MGEGYDKGAVDPDKFVRGEFIGKRFQVIQGQDRVYLTSYIHLGIILHAFAEKDVLEFDLNDLVFRLDEHKTIVAGVLDIDRSGEIVLYLVDRSEESLEGEGTVKIAEDVHVRFFLILFLLVCDTDNNGIVTGFLEAEHDPVIQEPYIPKDDIGLGLDDQGVDFCSRLTLTREIKPWGFGDIVFQQGALLIIILYDNTIECPHGWKAF